MSILLKKLKDKCVKCVIRCCLTDGLEGGWGIEVNNNYQQFYISWVLNSNTRKGTYLLYLIPPPDGCYFAIPFVKIV